MESTLALIKPDAWGRQATLTSEDWNSMLEEVEKLSLEDSQSAVEDQEQNVSETVASSNEKGAPDGSLTSNPPPDKTLTERRVAESTTEESSTMDCVEVVMTVIRKAGFAVIDRKVAKMDKVLAQNFYCEHKHKEIFPKLIQFMTSGPTVMILLRRENAIDHWRKIMQIIRKRLATDGTRNVVHGSDSAFSFSRESEILFKSRDVQRTFAMIKPDAMSKGVELEIKRMIYEAGLTIISQRRETLSEEKARAFYSEHNGKSFFSSLIQYITSGPLLVMALQGENAIKQWRLLLGPTNAEVAKEKVPDSVRARFGENNTKNAAHGSDSIASAERELKFWFPRGFKCQQTIVLLNEDLAELTSSSGLKKVDKAQSPLQHVIQRTNTTVLEKLSVQITHDFEESIRIRLMEKETTVNFPMECLKQGSRISILLLSSPGILQMMTDLFEVSSLERSKIWDVVYCSTTPECVRRDYSLFFGDASSLPCGADDSAVLSMKDFARSSLKGAGVGGSVSLHDLLLEGLQKLNELRLPGDQGVRYLGQWLLENNPVRRGRPTDKGNYMGEEGRRPSQFVQSLRSQTEFARG